MDDYVVLVDEKNQPVGTMPKLEAHSSTTPLHRGFSLFLFNAEGKLLVQQRSIRKKTWPGVWSNSCCGHPMSGEEPITAAKRRLDYELGIMNAEILMMLSDYRYRYERDGIVENEICPVMVGITTDEPFPNPEEVESTKWMNWDEWVMQIESQPENYSEWCVEETNLLLQDPAFLSFRKKFL